MKEIIDLVGSVIAPVTLITALLFYFGLIRTAAFSHAFGLDPSLLDLSVTDYVLRSVGAIFWPMGMGLAILLVALVVHIAVHTWTLSGDRKRRGWILGGVSIASGSILLGLTLVRSARGVGTSTAALITPILFGVGTAFVAYGVYLARSATPPKIDLPRRWRLLGRVVTICFLLLACFWAIGAYAQIVGQRQAQRVASNLDLLPTVILHSESDLGVQGPGVVVAVRSSKDMLYPYEYGGLYLLTRAADTFFLLPSGWSMDDGYTIAVKDTESVRLDLDAA